MNGSGVASLKSERTIPYLHLVYCMLYIPFDVKILSGHFGSYLLPIAGLIHVLSTCQKGFCLVTVSCTVECCLLCEPAPGKCKILHFLSFGNLYANSESTSIIFELQEAHKNAKKIISNLTRFAENTLNLKCSLQTVLNRKLNF